MSLDRPSQKTQTINQNSTLIHEKANLKLNLEDILKEINEETINNIMSIWSDVKNRFKQISESVKENIYTNFIADCYELVILVFKAMNLFLKKEENIIIENESSLTRLHESLGPLPIILDSELVEFLDMKKRSKDYSIGKRTANRLYEMVEKTMTSLNDVLNLVTQSF